MSKNKKIKGVKTPSRRKFFKAAAATGAAAAATVAMPNIALGCLLYTSPSPRDGLLSRMPSSA